MGGMPLSFPFRLRSVNIDREACHTALFSNGTLRSTGCHPGKPYDVASETPIFFSRARPDPNVLVPNKKEGRQSSCHSASPLASAISIYGD
jgi:hypothetical protein